MLGSLWASCCCCLDLSLLAGNREPFAASAHAVKCAESLAWQGYIQPAGASGTDAFVLEHSGARAAAGISGQGISTPPATVIHRAQQ